MSDEFTLPSALNKIAEGDEYEFVNLGVSGLISTQDVLRLTLLLAQDQVPDVFALYGGIADIAFAISEAPGYERNYRRNAARFRGETGGLLDTLLSRSNTFKVLFAVRVKARAQLAEDGPPYQLTDADRELVVRTVDIYLNNVRYVRKLGEAFDFGVLAFLQPYLNTGYEVEANAVTEFERGIYDSQDRRELALDREFYEVVRRRGEVIDLSHALIEWGGGNYFDPAHLGPKGNEIIARRIYAFLPGAGLPRDRVADH